MKRFFSASAVALALVLVTGAGVQASPITPASVKWDYNFTPGAPALFADGNPAAGITFTNQPLGHAKGTSDVVATNLSVFSASDADTPDVMSAGNYSLKLTLSTKDPLSGHLYSANLFFAGTLSGSFSSESSNVSNEFGPNSTQVVTMGAYTFTVSLYDDKGRPLYTPPGPPDPSGGPVLVGGITAHVTVAGGTTPPAAPEPSSMLLSALGLSFLGGAAWRKRKARARA